ncbi:Protein CONTINUOUS VASCULAR RING 1 [Geodia barretti]|uniref:Protein CONTINUOUS VASCULAR RING 1 n=1 Tax=Geodia barretti TaxID=519541 RepID=A0AA35QZF5_GEOBA|nr:Protein CONTINUOUS VASCULAR RING 1 [Geodia barretti]
MGPDEQQPLGRAEREEPTLGQRIEGHFQGKVLAGLMQLVPILVTVFVLAFIIGHTDGFIRPLPFVKDRPWDLPGVGLIGIIVVFYLIGLFVSVAVGRRTMGVMSFVLTKIPVVKTIFGVTEQATTILASDYNFSRVVFLEWPREGMVAIGFVTGRAFSQTGGHSLAIIYIPTVPNPTSGNMAFVNEDDLFETDLSVEDAIKLIFSGGIVLPERLAMARLPRDVEKKEREFIGRFETRPE